MKSWIFARMMFILVSKILQILFPLITLFIILDQTLQLQNVRVDRHTVKVTQPRKIRRRLGICP